MPKHIQVSNASALADLKAHIADLQQSRQVSVSSHSSSTTSQSRRSTTFWSRSNPGIEKRQQCDRELVRALATPTHRAVTQALERKAEIYNQLRKRKRNGPTGGPTGVVSVDDTLIDFDRKYLDASSSSSNPSSSEDEMGIDIREPSLVLESFQKDSELQSSPDNAMEEYIDEFGRTRRKPCRKSTGADSSSSMVTMKFVPATENTSTPNTTHYNPAQEIRALGTGHYRLSQCELGRRKQLADLNQLHQETNARRAENATVFTAYEARLQKRRDILHAAYGHDLAVTPASAQKDQCIEKEVLDFLRSIRYQ